MFGLYGVELAANVLGGITQQTINIAPDVRNEAASGAVWPSVVHLAAQAPAANFNTRSLTDALTWIPTTGLNIAGLTGPPAGLSLYAQKHADGATRGGAGTHIKYNIHQGLVVLRTLTCDHQQDADLLADIMATWDGAVAPIVKTEDTDLPATVPLDAKFTLGPVSVAGVTLTRVRNVTVDFGLTAATEGADSDVWDRESRISMIQPSILVQGIDPNWWKETGGIPIAGQPALHTDTTVYFRKRKDGATNVDDATAEHVKMTMAGIAVVEQGFSATGAALGEINVRVTGSYDGTNEPIVVTPASTIP